MLLARYPRPDPTYQNTNYKKEVFLAKEIISNFPKINELLDNFKDYERLEYTNAKNRIFQDCVEYSDISRWLPTMSIEAIKNHVKKFIIEKDCFSLFKKLDNTINEFYNQMPLARRNNFKKKISSKKYDESDSVFEEIIIAHTMMEKFGTESVQYEPRLLNGKYGDVLVSLNEKKIFLEITSITTSKAGEKIQKVLDVFAKELFERVEPKQRMAVRLDTTKFILDRTLIDADQSSRMLSSWISTLKLDMLSDFIGLISISEYKLHSGINEYKNYSLFDYPCCNSNCQTLKDKSIFSDWAKKVTVSDMIHSPITSIACDFVTKPSVTVSEDASHSTVNALRMNKNLPAMQVGLAQYESFLNQIKRKICSKYNKEQFECGHPVIFMIKCRLWSNQFETDNEDFSIIRKCVEVTIKSYRFVSGVLLYYTTHAHGRFIHNPNATDDVKLSDSTISSLFSN